jgi:hypothetical protein
MKSSTYTSVYAKGGVLGEPRTVADGWNVVVVASSWVWEGASNGCGNEVDGVSVEVEFAISAMVSV